MSIYEVVLFFLGGALTMVAAGFTLFILCKALEDILEAFEHSSDD